MSDRAAITLPVSAGLPWPNRRQVLTTGVGITGASLALPLAARPLASVIDLGNPRVALDAYVKLRGSTADETVFQPYEGDVFLIVDGRPGIPLCGFKGLQKSHWRRDGKGGFTNSDYDVGFYVDYKTRKILETWDNPLTGKTVEVFHYRGGPSGGHFTIGSDGGDVYGDAVGRWALVGDHIWHSSSRASERPNPMTPEEWPLASSGKTVFGSMSITFAGRVADVANPAVHQAPGYQIWTNTTGWMPWMEMGQRPGYNEWRWIGAKGTPRGQIDPALVASVEHVWPGYVSHDGVWSVPTAGRIDYMRLKNGLSVTR